MEQIDKYRIQYFDETKNEWIEDQKTYTEKEISSIISIRYPKNKTRVIRVIGKVQ